MVVLGEHLHHTVEEMIFGDTGVETQESVGLFLGQVQSPNTEVRLTQNQVSPLILGVALQNALGQLPGVDVLAVFQKPLSQLQTVAGVEVVDLVLHGLGRFRLGRSKTHLGHQECAENERRQGFHRQQVWLK